MFYLNVKQYIIHGYFVVHLLMNKKKKGDERVDRSSVSHDCILLWSN